MRRDDGWGDGRFGRLSFDEANGRERANLKVESDGYPPGRATARCGGPAVRPPTPWRGGARRIPLGEGAVLGAANGRGKDWVATQRRREGHVVTGVCGRALSFTGGTCRARFFRRLGGAGSG